MRPARWAKEVETSVWLDAESKRQVASCELMSALAMRREWEYVAQSWLVASGVVAWAVFAVTDSTGAMTDELGAVAAGGA